MPQISLSIKYRPASNVVISPSELIEQYFFGIAIQTKDGRKMSSDSIRLYIEAAQDSVEKQLDIKIIPQNIEEDLSFDRNDWSAWGYIRTTYPVKKPHSLEGYVNTVRQISYPAEWLSHRKTNDGQYYRHLFLVPIQGGAVDNNSMIFSGAMPHIGFLGNQTVPNYWKARYCTGFDKIPHDLVNIIGKLAAINVFHILGDLILGAGIASQSIGIDGLSQSISTTSSATNAGYGARIQGYLADLKKEWPAVKAYYKGFTSMAM